MRLASPKPGFCSSCMMADPTREYVDCDTAYDGAPVYDRETGTIAILPYTGQTASHDDLYICDRCVDEMRQLLGQHEYRDTIRRQVAEIQKLEIKIEHLTATVKRQQAELTAQYESAFGPSRPRRKVAA